MQETITKEEILQAIKECAEELGRAPSISELQKMKGVAKAAIYRKFGNYKTALELCGLERTGPGYQTELRGLFLDWAGVARSLGRLPTMGDYEARGKYSIQPLLRRYGVWGDVPAGMAEYVKAQGIESEWSDVLELIKRGRSSVRGMVRRSVPPRAKLMEDQPVYGAPLTFGPLTFAPTNEGGVMFLFGALAEELGFAVLRIQPGFPDCEAMREIKPGVWQRVRIEFEFESRNFVAHEHRVDGCEIIVCWNHNWEACPLEVIELRKVFEGMKEKIGR
jgi:hypothetical protein